MQEPGSGRALTSDKIYYVNFHSDFKENLDFHYSAKEFFT